MLALTNRRVVYGNTIQMQEMQQCLIFFAFGPEQMEKPKIQKQPDQFVLLTETGCSAVPETPRRCWLNLYFDLRLTFEPLAIIRRSKNSSLRTVFQPKRRAPVASNRISCGSKCVTDKLRVRVGIWVWAIEEKRDTDKLVITHTTDWIVASYRACLGQNDLLLQCP